VDVVTAGTLALVIATLLVSLVAGFLFAFAVVVMPGIGELDDGDFVRAFQRIDGVIQRGDPLFGLVFVGSIVALVALAVATVAGLLDLGGIERSLLYAAGGIYLAGVLVPTGIVNVPLNNELQRLDVDALDAAERKEARGRFEPRWNRWNRIRTALACVSAVLMTGLLTL
jgi:uncharacterized membrane protein